MLRGVRWKIQDVTGADANCRLDQMSILNRFAEYVWTRERLADGDADCCACNPKRLFTGALVEKMVGLCKVINTQEKKATMVICHFSVLLCIRSFSRPCLM